LSAWFCYSDSKSEKAISRKDVSLIIPIDHIFQLEVFVVRLAEYDHKALNKKRLSFSIICRVVAGYDFDERSAGDQGFCLEISKRLQRCRASKISAIFTCVNSPKKYCFRLVGF